MSDHHICLRPVLHNGKTYPKGSSVEMEASEAAPLIASLIILPAAIRDDVPVADPEIPMIDTIGDALALEAEEGALVEEADVNALAVEAVMTAIRDLGESAYTASDPRKPLTSAISDAMRGDRFISAAIRDEAWERLVKEGFIAPASAEPQ